MGDPNSTIALNKSRFLINPAQTMRFPNEDIPYKMLLSFKEYSYSPSSPVVDGGANALVANSKGSVILPLPLQLNDVTGVESTTTSAAYAAMGKMGLDKLSGSSDASTFSLDNMALFADLTSKALGGAALYAKQKGLDRLSAVLGVGVGGVAAATSDTAQLLGGFAVNPFETLQFKGVKLKTHSFTWRLSPSSVDESESLRNIINMIKANILPSYFDSDNTTAHALLKYPAIASISFYGIDQNYYYKLKPAMITSFSARYNGGDQLNIYRGGKPAIVDLSMDLTELTIHTSADYGGPTYDTSSVNAAASLPNMNEAGVIDTGGITGYNEYGIGK